MKDYKFKTVAIAGTFDRLHKGHRYIISESFKSGERVIIGLTSDSFVKKKLQITNNKLQIKWKNYKERKKELVEFLSGEKLLKRAEIVEINDIYGPTLDKNDIEALVVTLQTLPNAQKINKKRERLGFGLLEIKEVPLVIAEDKKVISSTRIRMGEIDRWGRVFASLSIYGGKIPDKLRLRLKKPLGNLIKGSSVTIERAVNEQIKLPDLTSVATVGDEATLFLNRLGRQPDISVVDFHIKRVRVHQNLKDLEFPEVFWRESYKDKIIKAENPAGFITTELVRVYKTALERFIKDGKKRIVEVTGEEDLAGLPAILLAPLGSVVIYGQPDEGIVAVTVTESKKREILKLVNLS